MGTQRAVRVRATRRKLTGVSSAFGHAEPTVRVVNDIGVAPTRS